MASDGPAQAAAAVSDPLQYDLTTVLSKSLDRHLVFPLLEFLSQKELYAAEDIEAAKLELIEKTNMVDYAVDIYQGLNHTEEVPEQFVTRRGEVVNRLRTLEAEVKPITDFLSNADSVKMLKQDKSQNQAFLQAEFGIRAEHIEALYHLAKWNFECGNYSAAAEYLHHYRNLGTNPERGVSALWGKLAADVLLQDFETGMEDLLKLKDLLDIDTFAPVARQLQSRSWLMHWSLFVFFNHENGLNALIDLFLQERYLTALQLLGQHLLRYLAVAVVVNKRRRSALKDLVRVIQQESYEYADPITGGAHAWLARCGEVLDNDFFLAAAREAFLDAARTMLFETFCRVHQEIDMAGLSQQLGLDTEATEKWIVNLIRGARLNAKIDAKAGTVIMQAQGPGGDDVLLEKARSLSMRTFALSNTLVGILKA
ncbi:hypothetical protein QBZ16_004733 [Prototheca wickerhamii]|uniref:Eukaryotic translation initiation factor 3 subunit E n=1 Tax=Prototheca wickerhamii TaxID=3111 RepID=A0AAD9MGK2_PROWI|nr:hypothetical protein QBZ16_004733 [Prototheca wickerhamii]